MRDDGGDDPCVVACDAHTAPRISNIVRVTFGGDPHTVLMMNGCHPMAHEEVLVRWMKGEYLANPQFRRRNLAQDLYVTWLDTRPHRSGQDGFGPPPANNISDATESGEETDQDEQDVGGTEAATSSSAYAVSTDPGWSALHRWTDDFSSNSLGRPLKSRHRVMALPCQRQSGLATGFREFPPRTRQQATVSRCGYWLTPARWVAVKL